MRQRVPVHRAPSRTRSLTILDAMTNPALYGRFFQGSSWESWRTLSRAMLLSVEEREEAWRRLRALSAYGSAAER